MQNPQPLLDVILGMATYRAYLLDPSGRITWGEWFEAEDDDAAFELARTRCRVGVPQVELWRGRDRLGRFICTEKEVSRADKPS